MSVLTSPYIKTNPNAYFSTETREIFIRHIFTEYEIEVKKIIEGFLCPECEDWFLLIESTTGEYGLYLHDDESPDNLEAEWAQCAYTFFVFPCSQLDGTVKLIEELYDWEQGEIIRLASRYRQEGKILKSEEIKNDFTFSIAYTRGISEGYSKEVAMTFAALNR